MRAGLMERVEGGAERGAAALFAGAVAYAAFGLLGTTGVEPQLALGAAGAGALAYLPCSRLLRVAAGRDARFALPEFALQDFAFVDAADELLLTEQVVPEELLLTERRDSDELLLTDADRVHSGPEAADQASLVLDDILAELGPDARVVRLFDRKAMAATPGELQSRIADHLKDGAHQPAPPNPSSSSDASQALSAALAELRRSLR